MYVEKAGYNPAELTRAVFAVEGLTGSRAGPFGGEALRLMENIGPAKDISGRITAVVRVVEAWEACVPEDVNQAFGTAKSAFGPARQEDRVYSVKTAVAKDLKKLLAAESAKKAADEFLKAATEDGWEKALEKFNSRYGKQAGQDDDAPSASAEKPFRLENRTGLRRIAGAELATLAVRTSGDPSAAEMVKNQRIRARFAEALYELGAESAVENVIMEFEPELAFYVIKSASVSRMTREDYEKIKAQVAFMGDLAESQSLAAVYLDPNNIISRSKFRFIEVDRTQSGDSADSEGST
jgi:hypothetical protein